MKKRSQIKMALIGFDGSEQASLELFISRHVDGFELVPEKHASTIIFNADQSADIDELERDYRVKYNKQGIVISHRDVSWQGMESLKKPYGIKELTACLSVLSEQRSIADDAEDALQSPSEDELQDVLTAFRESFQRGQNPDLEEQAKVEKRKAFQQGLMARKRRAEQLASGPENVLKEESLSDLLARQPETSNNQDFEKDLLAMTKEVMAKESLSKESLLLDLEDSANSQLEQGIPVLLHPNIQDVQDSCGNLPDFDLTDGSQNRNVFFSPKGQLLEFALEARKQGLQQQQSQHLVGLPSQYLQYDPESDLFMSTLDFELLLQMAQLRFRFGELKLQTMTSEAQLHESASYQYFPAMTLLWRLACYSSKGKLPEGQSLTRRYILDSDLPSNVIVDLPRTAAIIKLWQSEKLSANELMERLHVEQRFVFPFMTAATSLGWLN